MSYITENATRMQALMYDLLDFSRVGARAVDYFTVVSNDAALQDAVENLKAKVVESAAVITHDPLPQVFADPIQLTRLFQNLTINSIKYRKHDQVPRIHFSARLEDSHWTFSVQDNGIGIDPQYREKVFGIFKRLLGRDNPGTGTGLAICKKIVSTHGGRMWVDSDPGLGSIFFFTLPCRD